MSGTNITRAEAAERSATVRVHGYQVDLDLSRVADPEHPEFPSTTTVRFAATSGSTTWIDLIAPTVRRAVLNGVELPADAFTGYRIALTGLQEENELRVEADCAYMHTGEGLHRFFDPVDKQAYVYTQFEVADARRVYACFDQPDLKGTYQFTVTAPADWQVVSNAVTPTPQPLRDGLAQWEFAPTAVMSTYITALVAGPYHVVRDEYVGTYGSYPLGVYCRASLGQYLDADEILTVTKEGFAHFEEAFATPYPFGKYDQLFVPEFNAGAMENAGAVTHTEEYVFRSRVTDAAYEQRANTILHELAHMWFGDLVTMTWWDDLWLNESFAEWASHWANAEATRYRDAWTTFNNLRKTWGYRQDQLPSTHPIVADMVDLAAVEVNFDGITYAKGASALRQLVAWVGEKEFLAGLRTYFAKYAWGNTRLADLLGELEASSGRDLHAWAALWLETSGVNSLRCEIELDDDGRYSRVTVVQDPPTTPPGIDPVLRPHRIALGLYDHVDGRLSRVQRVEIDVTGARTDVPALIGLPAADMLLPNDDDLTFAKIRLDERSLAAAVRYLDPQAPPLPRALVWGAAWDMTRDAEMSAGDFLTLVLHGLSGETDIGVTQQVLAQLRAAIEQYADPAHRADYRDRLATAMAGALAAAAPGSDQQVVFARAFAYAARTPAHTAAIAGWLDGEGTPDGLAIDTDLRWTLLLRLVTLGVRGEADIDAELARDDTATGRRHAAAARAALPTPEAKQAAFDAIIGDDSLPNAIRGAMIQGFGQPDQRELLVPFVEPYLAALPDVWRDRTNETAQSITLGLYPALLVSPETIERTDRFLRGDLDTGTRRLVGECRDGVARALRAQAKDAATG
jgi:aminopeptidase N